MINIICTQLLVLLVSSSGEHTNEGSENKMIPVIAAKVDVHSIS